MADSNITKNALAQSLKNLMKTVPFNKITISNICDGCEMNRKSFYYHFKDKYDLVNWIFDTEFLEESKKNSYSNSWDFLNVLCGYFYENHAFYRKAFKITGQNSFSEHFIEKIMPLFRYRLSHLAPDESIQEFQIEALADFFLITIQKWIMQKDCVAPEQFLHSLKTLIYSSAIKIHDEISTEYNI